jgi:glycosyltransferase involved in cell wall biosynthesis
MACCIGRLKGICKAGHVGLIYANGSRAAFYGGVVGRLSSIPVIWHCRVSDPDPYLDFILLRLVNRIVANSRATGSRFPLAFQGKIDVVYNGFDLEWLRDPSIAKPAVIQDDWRAILVVARASRWKRHDLILKAFDSIAQTEQNAHLICVGAKDHYELSWWEELQKITRQSPFTSRIHWVGAADDIRPWYRAASLMVLPSTNEPFGRVVVEAMASGLPVIAIRSGGIPEIVTDMQNGLLVPENDVAALAAAVLKILHDPSLQGRLVEAGRERAERFSIDAHIHEMVNVFTDVVACSRKN